MTDSGGPFLTTSLSVLVIFQFGEIVIVSGVKWYLTVVLNGIALVISGAKHLVIYLLAICTFSLEKTSIQVLCPWFNGVLCFLAINLLEFVYLGHYSLIFWLINNFSYSVDCLFPWWLVFFAMQKLCC